MQTGARQSLEVIPQTILWHMLYHRQHRRRWCHRLLPQQPRHSATLPQSILALCDMMLEWGDQEEQERDHLPWRDNNNSKRHGDSRFDRNQRNFDKKCTPDDTVATVNRGHHEKKLGGQQDDFHKLLNKSCSLTQKQSTRSSSALTCGSPSKKKGKQNEEDNYRDGLQGFQ